MRGKEIFWKLVSCVDVTPDQTTHQNKKLANASCFQFRWLHHWAGSNTELIACTAHMSKICFAQLLWSVQGETHKGKSSKLLPLFRKNWRLLHRLLSWLPYLFITCCLIWVDSDESTLSLFGNRLGTNKSRWCGLSVFSELYNREGMVSPQWFVPAAMVSLPSPRQWRPRSKVKLHVWWT